MPITSPQQLQAAIIWTHKRPSGDGEVRYGTHAGNFYQQFMPSGAAMPQLYPPRLISQVTYYLGTKNATKLS